MFRKTYEVLGYPGITINSLNKTYNQGETFSLLSSEINQEVNGLVSMGLLKEIKKVMTGIQSIKDMWKPKASLESVQQVSNKVDSTHTELKELILNVEKSILGQLDKKLENISSVGPASPSSSKVINIKKESISEASLLEEEDLNNSVIYIRPDDKDLQASKEVESSVSEGNVDDAVNKLKGRRGRR